MSTRLPPAGIPAWDDAPWAALPPTVLSLALLVPALTAQPPGPGGPPFGGPKGPGGFPGGQERTEAQYRELLDRGGFKLVRVVLTSADVSVLEAVKV